MKMYLGEFIGSLLAKRKFIIDSVYFFSVAMGMRMRAVVVITVGMVVVVVRHDVSE